MPTCPQIKELRARVKRFSKTSPESNPAKFESCFKKLKALEAAMTIFDAKYVKRFSADVRDTLREGWWCDTMRGVCVCDGPVLWC